MATTLLSYSTNHLTLQGVVGQLLPWGKGSMGNRQFWQGCQTLTTGFPKGDLSSITLMWRKGAAFFTHGGSHNSPLGIGNRIFPHARRQLISSHGILIREESIFPIHVFVGSGFFPCMGSRLDKAQWLGSLYDGFVVVYPHYLDKANRFCIAQ